MTRHDVPIDAATILRVLGAHGVEYHRRARPVGVRAPAPISIPESGVLELDTDFGGVDIHASPPGAASYPELRARAMVIRLDVDVAVAGRDDLIAMKRASGRPIDRADIIALTEP